MLMGVKISFISRHKFVCSRTFHLLYLCSKHPQQQNSVEWKLWYRRKWHALTCNIFWNLHPLQRKLIYMESKTISCIILLKGMLTVYQSFSCREFNFVFCSYVSVASVRHRYQQHLRLTSPIVKEDEEEHNKENSQDRGEVLPPHVAFTAAVGAWDHVLLTQPWRGLSSFLP